MTPAEKIIALEKLLETPGWKDVLAPVLQRRIDAIEQEILSGKLSHVDYRLKADLRTELEKIVKKPQELLNTEERKEREKRE